MNLCNGTGQIGHTVDISEFCPCPGCDGCTPKEIPVKKFVAVHFDGGGHAYDFFTFLDLKRGDKVIVMTVNGLVITTVARMLKRSDKANNWVIQKIDMEHFEELKEALKQAKKDKKLAEKKAKVYIEATPMRQFTGSDTETDHRQW